MYVITHYRYVRVTERYRKNCTWRKWLTYCSCGKFITLLTFELSSFRENGFYFYCIFHAVAADTSRWTPKSARRQNTENGHTDTHTDTQDNYCNPRHACTPRVNKYLAGVDCILYTQRSYSKSIPVEDQAIFHRSNVWHYYSPLPTAKAHTKLFVVLHVSKSQFKELSIQPSICYLSFRWVNI